MSQDRWNGSIKIRTTDGLALVRDLDWSYQAPLVRSSYDPFRGSSREYVWTDDAACNGLDPSYFNYQLADDLDYQPETVLVRGKTGKAGVRRSNEIRLKKGQVACLTCPVAQKCLDEATASDVFWTTRGGYLPAFLENPGADYPKVSTFDMIE